MLFCTNLLDIIVIFGLSEVYYGGNTSRLSLLYLYFHPLDGELSARLSVSAHTT